jgi:hypothetical protein
MNNYASDEYGQLIELMKGKYGAMIKTVNTDGDIRRVVGMYLDEMYGHEMSNGEVIDFFCVDTPSIISSIENNQIESRILEVFDELNPIFFKKYYGDNSGRCTRDPEIEG